MRERTRSSAITSDRGSALAKLPVGGGGAEKIGFFEQDNSLKLDADKFSFCNRFLRKVKIVIFPQNVSLSDK